MLYYTCTVSQIDILGIFVLAMLTKFLFRVHVSLPCYRRFQKSLKPALKMKNLVSLIFIKWNRSWLNGHCYPHLRRMDTFLLLRHDPDIESWNISFDSLKIEGRDKLAVFHQPLQVISFFFAEKTVPELLSTDPI